MTTFSGVTNSLGVTSLKTFFLSSPALGACIGGTCAKVTCSGSACTRAANTRDACIGSSYAMGACTKGAYLGGAGTESACTGDTGVVEHSRIHSQSFSIFEVGGAGLEI